MENRDALNILRNIAKGIDPFTGELLSENGIFRNPQTVLALKCVISTIEPKQVDENESQKTLSNAGKFWSPREDKVLCARYDAGTSIIDLAAKHGRTHGAITIRLVKLGKVQAGTAMDQKISNKKSTQIRTRTMHPVQPLDTKLPPKLPTAACIDCGNKFFADPNRATLFAHLCEACYRRRIEEKKNIQVKQKIITRRIDEGIAGTREDHKKMRSWKLS